MTSEAEGQPKRNTSVSDRGCVEATSKDADSDGTSADLERLDDLASHVLLARGAAVSSRLDVRLRIAHRGVEAVDVAP
jgi:hypothetical protein